MVKDVGVFQVESVAPERLAVEVAAQHQRRRGDQIDADGVGHPDLAQSLHFLAHPGTDAQRLGGVGEKSGALEILEEGAEHLDFSGPVSGGPYLAEFGVEGLVELALDVWIVGGVTRPDLETRGCAIDAWSAVDGGGWFKDREGGPVREKEEERYGNKEREKETSWYEWSSIVVFHFSLSR